MPSVIDKSGNVDYFGQLSWVNLVDWVVTLCLGFIVIATAVQLGGVRPETQHGLLPMYGVLMVLHGLWLAVNKERPLLLNPIPFLFVPFLLWASYSVLFLSPAPWRGAYELSYFFGAFLFAWVAVNNVRTRAHLWLLIICALVPAVYAVFIGFYQFFQEPLRMADASAGYPLQLSSQFVGQSTGNFADPNSFAIYLLVLLPGVMIAAFVPRLPKILRVLCFYIGLMLVVGITFTQTYWASAVVVLLMATVPWFCFKEKRSRILASGLGVGMAMTVFFGMFFYNPLFKKGLSRSVTSEGEGIRLVLWKEALKSLSESPAVGTGGGSYMLDLEHSSSLSLDRLPLTPHNDFLLILGQYGVLGALLLFFSSGLCCLSGFSVLGR